ncbi:MAG: exopolysaccharide biosynthesis polyprenyl glycosylphosphotransferase [Solirubrobacterales bacterium]|nr:exopolysaccharide biosynthesis polyprenyl glycosylphosphotransferase [Solirubrobacterales bacterium]
MFGRGPLTNALSSPRRRPASERLTTPRLARRAIVGGGPIVEAATPAASLRRDRVYRGALVTADCAAVTLCLLVVVLAFPGLDVRLWAGGVLVAAVLFAKLFGLYSRDEMLLRKTTLEEMPNLFHLATLCAMIFWIGHDVAIRGDVNARAALLLWASLTVAIPVMRVLARTLSVHLTAPERCLVIGDQLTLHNLVRRLGRGSGINAEIVGHIDLEGEEIAPEHGFAEERLTRVKERVRELGIHRVIVAPRSADGGGLLDLVGTLKEVGTRVSLIPRVLEVLGTSVEFDDVHGIIVMGVRSFRLSRSSALIKRSFDVGGALFLLLLFAPLMALIALATKLESRGPVLFRQVRVGRRGSQFDMLKFRSMVANAEALKPGLQALNDAESGFFKMADDPRITRVGRLLRRTSLDELPQLLNVLRGEMSLVGPRPLIHEEDQQILGWSRRRLDLTPGMTGPWQVLGSSRIPLREMVAMDCVYVTTWSLWTDIKILMRTIAHVFQMRGI